jgi:ferredoxin
MPDSPCNDEGITPGNYKDKTSANEKTFAEDIPPAEKSARFREEIDKCILCFSCRQACYGCYCKTCFIERDMPDWMPAEVDVGTKMTFHLGRAMHLAGRCVECGACEAACASGVNLRYIIQELTDFTEELYGSKTGMELGTPQALVSYRLDDKEVGFLGEGQNE